MKTSTRAWHRPKCSTCGQPIVDIDDAWAVWLSPSGKANTSPGIVDGRCERRIYALRQIGSGLHMSLRVTALRTVPNEAIVIALNREASSEPERLIWASWLSVVLGLPCGELLNFTKATADRKIMDHVMTLTEAEKICS